MHYTVDRIENGIAVLEDDMLMLLPVPLKLLPEGIREGSILVYDGSSYVIRHDEEAEQRKKLFALQKKLLGKNKCKPQKK